MLKEKEACHEAFEKHFKKEMVPLTTKQQQDLDNAARCHICDGTFCSDQTEEGDKCHWKGDKKARDNCHVIGQIHRRRPLRLQPGLPTRNENPRHLPHLVMQAIGQFKKDVSVIPCNMEKYMLFTFDGNVVFLDSVQFMNNQSLACLAGVLPDDAFTLILQHFKDKDKLALVKRKGTYPYDYMDSFNKFKETQLPRKEAFFSLLSDESISDEDYKYA